MTVWRIRTDLIFTKKPDAVTVGLALKEELKKVVNLLEEKSFIELEECHHDESPPQPCKVIQRIEK